MNKVRNRTAFVFSAIARFHGGAVAKHHEDAGQIAALACLVHSDDAGAVRMGVRMFRRAIGYRRPKMLSIASIDVPDGFDRDLVENCAMGRLWPIVERLTPRHREAIVRVEVDGVSRPVVAEELGVSAAELGQMLRTARKRLRRLCEIEGIRP